MEYRLLGASGSSEVSVLNNGHHDAGRRRPFCRHRRRAGGRGLDVRLKSAWKRVNVFDTADIYSFGKSEKVLGKRSARTAKYRAGDQVLRPASDRAAPTKSGLSRTHIIEACEKACAASARINGKLYQAHNFDAITPLDETLRAFDDLVQAGKIRHFGSSNYSGWQLMKAHATADRLAVRRYISQQINYSLIARGAEHDLVPVGLDQITGIMAWSPLQFGLLSGKFRRGGEKPAESTPQHSRRTRGDIDYDKALRGLSMS